MRRQGLRTRLERLERQRNRRPFPRVIFGIFDKEPDEVIGYEGSSGGTSMTILRQPGEALETLRARAWQLVSAPTLFTLYGAFPARQSISPPPPHAPAPPPAPGDPWALAGIGREASREELTRMGAVPVPPERLIEP